MPVRLGRGSFLLIDGQAIDDYETIADGAIETIPQVNGTAGCVLFVGSFVPRID